MSNVRVNLLPGEVRERHRAGQHRALAGIGVIVLLLALGGLWFLKKAEVGSARDRLAEEEAIAQDLRAEVAELTEYAEIAAALDDADSHLSQVLGGEIGVAGVLQDLAVVMPSGVELESLGYAATPDSELITVGQLTLNGRTIDRHAPGLERVLLELDKVAAFRAPYFGSAAIDNDDAVAFDVSVQLGREVLTGRYVEGIPEVLR